MKKLCLSPPLIAMFNEHEIYLLLHIARRITTQKWLPITNKALADATGWDIEAIDEVYQNLLDNGILIFKDGLYSIRKRQVAERHIKDLP